MLFLLNLIEAWPKMTRCEIEVPKSNPHFIGAWSIEPMTLCDDITYFFERNISIQKKGVTGAGLSDCIKNRTDISILPRDIGKPGYEIFKDYFQFLLYCYKDYLQQWPFLQEWAPTLDVGIFNIGRYNQGQHFNSVHAERSLNNLHRFFAFMTYLSDVESGGSTYFTHYDLEIQPQKGLTIIWPADWTHAHKGNIIEAGTKYIITGWLDVTRKTDNLT